jgi:23S rRNA pseudouridine2605 synthase
MCYIEGEAKSEIGLKKIIKCQSSSQYLNTLVMMLRIDRVSFAGLTKKNLPRGN